MATKEGVCKGCGKKILWIDTTGGKKMPCDLGKVTIVTGIGATYQGYMPHWDSCPHGDEFRKKEIANKVKGK